MCLCHLFLRLIRAVRAVSGHPEGEGHVSIVCVQCERLPEVPTLFAFALPAECVPDPKNFSVRVLKMAAGHAFAFSSSESAYVLDAARFLFFLSQNKLCRVFFLL